MPNKLLDENTLTAIKDYVTSNYVTLSTPQTISGAKTFTSDLTLGGKIYLYGNNDNWNIEVDSSYNQFRIAHNTTRHYTFNDSAIIPVGTKDLGYPSYKWRDLYLSRNLTDGTNNITVEEIVNKQDAIQVKRYI